VRDFLDAVSILSQPGNLDGSPDDSVVELVAREFPTMPESELPPSEHPDDIDPG
jgi:hypothetical protein